MTEQITETLSEYLAAVTDLVIRKEVFDQAGDAKEAAEPQGRW